MKEGVRFIGTDNDDMVEFLKYIRENGGQCVCTDYEAKTIEVIRGTKKNEKTTVYAHSTDGEVIELFNVDGVLGSVNVDASGSETD